MLGVLHSRQEVKKMVVTFSLMFLTLLVYTSTTLAGSPQSGTFSTADGSHCTWFDLRVSETELALATACICKDKDGKSQSYGCQYTGELYGCDEFKNKSREILLGLVEQLAAYNSSCDAAKLNVPQCSMVSLEREILHEVKSPCVQAPAGHEEL